MIRRFHKMHGLGNDFALFDGRVEPIEMTASLARAIADRHAGIGCDQIVLLELATTAEADVRMRIFNADGSEVEACGNATRCVALLIGGRQRIETFGGLLNADVTEGGATVEMGQPRFEWDTIPIAYPLDTAAMPVGWEELQTPFALNVGNPHVVFFVEDADAVDLAQLGPLIETDLLFPERINVNVASVADGRVKLRVWERGAGLTMACGTGACATAVAAISKGLTVSPVDVDLPGGTLSIAWAPGETIRMTGDATHVFTGEIDLEALQ